MLDYLNIKIRFSDSRSIIVMEKVFFNTGVLVRVKKWGSVLTPQPTLQVTKESSESLQSY